MSSQTLVLTPWMTPHKIVGWEVSIVDSYLGKVEVLEEYEETVSSPSITFQVPAVVRLKRHVNHNKRGIKFSRINVFTRDGFRCQYCGTKKEMKGLNYDHVIPRVQGGKTNWENIVAACFSCNSKKDGRTPEQAGMKLLSRPVKPKSLPMTAPIIYLKAIPELWKPYLADHALTYADVG